MAIIVVVETGSERKKQKKAYKINIPQQGSNRGQQDPLSSVLTIEPKRPLSNEMKNWRHKLNSKLSNIFHESETENILHRIRKEI